MAFLEDMGHGRRRLPGPQGRNRMALPIARVRAHRGVVERSLQRASGGEDGR